MALTSGSKIEVADINAISSTANSALSTANTANTTATNAYNLANSKQNALGFIPVQQGGGIGQGTNKVYIGWSGNQLKCTVDQTDIGAFSFGSGGISAVKGQIGSAWAANGTSMTLPSGGTWFVWNIFANGNGNVPYFATNTSVSNSGISIGGGTYAGGTTVYALHRSYEDIVASGKLAAIRIA